MEVTLFSDSLYSNSTGFNIPQNQMEISPSSFSLSKNGVEKVNISLNNIGETNPGTYQGTILVTASTATSNVTLSSIAVIAKIEIEHSAGIKLTIIGIMIALIGVTLGLGHYKDKIKKFPRFVVVVIGLIAISLWVFLITNTTVSFYDPGNIVSTVIIVPFMGYLIFFVKDDKKVKIS